MTANSRPLRPCPPASEAPAAADPRPAPLASSIDGITRLRAAAPDAIRLACAQRTPFDTARLAHPLFVLAADHPARGAVAAGGDPTAMGDRHELLARCVTALARPGVDGFLGTADLVEDLMLLGALDGKLVLGSMNRGGLPGASFELDDRFTGYDAPGVAAAGLDGGKVLLRIDPEDPGTADTLAGCSHAVQTLAARRLLALVEPFRTHRVAGRVVNILEPDAQIYANNIAQGLGSTSAYTWLKVPVVDEMERMMASTTLPTLLLGGEGADGPDERYAAWQKALRIPQVRGLILGRTMLFPDDGDVAAAVDTAASLLDRGPSAPADAR
ncbi:Cgl0159 family (beta/alpha)8-fold protein [Streptomyces sp. H39-S7]|uniref:Cgl0159 family (beta/alpha)8-fold protein n=1 Tax=Streptomyces sp. H39-S7 TaxID=3004357 RepID=UPI0022B02745|nr:deoxyribose-phosphate aldolase [Streptomyces sp. H39-S7]MCZ4123874.1 deoxyribose-phosphate aldolase [Streptomyces sp. H39-S7]